MVLLISLWHITALIAYCAYNIPLTRSADGFQSAAAQRYFLISTLARRNKRRHCIAAQMLDCTRNIKRRTHSAHDTHNIAYY